jgi:ketosteroid isomerase-like protein
MTEKLSPVEIAVAYLEAFGRQDLATAAGYIADDIVFESPRVTLTGAKAYLAAVGEFAQAVASVEIIAALGDDERAMVMYDMKTGPFGTIRAADSFAVRDGKITCDLLVFDTRPLGT